jgi:glycerophosphoryl diester phosphodiesterase
MDSTGGPADKAAPSYAAMITPAGLKVVAAYAWGIGPNKDMVDKGEGEPSALVADAHAAGLRVHVWTFRAENFFLPASLRKGADPRAHGDVDTAIRRQLAAGIDGFFTDFPLIGAKARAAYRASAGK